MKSEFALLSSLGLARIETLMFEFASAPIEDHGLGLGSGSGLGSGLGLGFKVSGVRVWLGLWLGVRGWVKGRD